MSNNVEMIVLEPLGDLYIELLFPHSDDSTITSLVLRVSSTVLEQSSDILRAKLSPRWGGHGVQIKNDPSRAGWLTLDDADYTEYPPEAVLTILRIMHGQLDGSLHRTETCLELLEILYVGHKWMVMKLLSSHASLLLHHFEEQETWSEPHQYAVLIHAAYLLDSPEFFGSFTNRLDRQPLDDIYSLGDLAAARDCPEYHSHLSLLPSEDLSDVDNNPAWVLDNEIRTRHFYDAVENLDELVLHHIGRFWDRDEQHRVVALEAKTPQEYWAGEEYVGDLPFADDGDIKSVEQLAIDPQHPPQCRFFVAAREAYMNALSQAGIYPPRKYRAFVSAPAINSAVLAMDMPKINVPSCGRAGCDDEKVRNDLEIMRQEASDAWLGLCLGCYKKKKYDDHLIEPSADRIRCRKGREQGQEEE